MSTLMSHLTDRLMDRLTDRLTDRLMNQLTDKLTGKLISRHRRVVLAPVCSLLMLAAGYSVPIPLHAAQLPATSQMTTTSYTYDSMGNLVSVTDPLNNVTTYRYDAFGRQISSVNALKEQVQLGYNGQGQVISVTDPRNLTTTYKLDGLGNRIALTSPDTGTTRQQTDIMGNVTSSTDAKGQTTMITYDVFNRPVGLVYADGSSVKAEYDQGSYGIGHLTRIVELNAAATETGSITYSYDQEGHLLQDSRIFGAVNGEHKAVISYARDQQGQLSGMTYPDGRVISYTRDKLGRIERIDSVRHGVTVALVRDVVYGPGGNVISYVSVVGNAGKVTTTGKTMRFPADLDGRITSYDLGVSGASGKTSASSVASSTPANLASSFGQQGRTLAYDANSRLVTQADSVATVHYGYDADNRLTSAISAGDSHGPSISYSYDGVGNRVTMGHGGVMTHYVYADNSNQLIRIRAAQDSSILSDANGSIVQHVASQFSYDTRGRMVSAKTASGVVRFQINPLGQRVFKINAANVGTAFYYDQDGRLIGERSGANGADYVYLNDMPVAFIRY